MKINIHAGHTRQNGKSPGAGSAKTGIWESIEDRKIKDEVIRLLKKKGHIVYDCTDDKGSGQSDNLRRIVKKCNAHKVDLDISIHLNHFNGNAYGVEAYTYSTASKARGFAKRAVQNIHKVGFAYHSGDRELAGALKTANYYVLRETVAPACLIECFFCDSKIDAKIYKKKGYKKIAEAIAKAVTR